MAKDGRKIHASKLEGLDITCMLDVGRCLPGYDAKVFDYMLRFNNPRSIWTLRTKKTDPFAEVPCERFTIARTSFHWWCHDMVQLNAKANLEPTKLELACIWLQFCIRWWRRKWEARMDLVDNPYMADPRRDMLREALSQIDDPELVLYQAEHGGVARLQPYQGVHGGYMGDVVAEVERLEREAEASAEEVGDVQATLMVWAGSDDEEESDEEEDDEEDDVEPMYAVVEDSAMEEQAQEVAVQEQLVGPMKAMGLKRGREEDEEMEEATEHEGHSAKRHESGRPT